MADFTTSVSDNLNLFGLEVTTKWGSATWGTHKWAVGAPLLNILTLETGFSESVTHSDAYGNDYTIVDNNNLASTFEGTREELLTGNGYNYVFPGPSINEESDHEPTWTAGSSTDPTWTSGVTAGGSWT